MRPLSDRRFLVTLRTLAEDVENQRNQYEKKKPTLSVEKQRLREHWLEYCECSAKWWKQLETKKSKIQELDRILRVHTESQYELEKWQKKKEQLSLEYKKELAAARLELKIPAPLSQEN